MMNALSRDQIVSTIREIAEEYNRDQNIPFSFGRFLGLYDAISIGRDTDTRWNHINKMATDTITVRGEIRIVEHSGVNIRDAVFPDIDYCVDGECESALPGYFYVPAAFVKIITAEPNIVTVGTVDDDHMPIQEYIREVLEKEIIKKTDVIYTGLVKEAKNPYDLEIIYLGTSLDGDRAKIEFSVRVE